MIGDCRVCVVMPAYNAARTLERTVAELDRAVVDRVLVVDDAEALQRRLLMARDGIDAVLAEAMIGSQSSRGARLAAADDVIRNSGSVDDLKAQVRAADRRYRVLGKL